MRMLRHDDVVRFVAIDKTPGGTNLGRAEFVFCPMWRCGRLERFFIEARQQRDLVDTQYVVETFKGEMFCVQSWTHRGIKEPRVWSSYWCKEHKTIALRVYVPNNANCFTVCTLQSGCGVNFDRVERGISLSL